jgi:predicted HTH domain antitoxin
MSRQVVIEFPDELPEEILRDPEIVKEGKTAIVLKMLRRGTISQGKAAELLEIDRHTLFNLMAEHHISAIEMTEKELGEELSKPFGPAGADE